MWNASAISGEYLSAASFLGVAGLILKYGVDMLWYPVGYAAGYLILLLFVAAPLRRSGAYTIPDFAESRFDSARLRKVATGFVLLIGWFYLLPQMKGAGVTLSVLAGTPYWVGVVVVGTVITANVALGGMRGITFVQAFQYWVKVTAIALPAIVILGYFQRDGRPELTRAEPPTFTETTDVEFDAAATFVVDEELVVDATGIVDGEQVDGPITLGPGEHSAAEDTAITFPAGSAVPHHVDVPSSEGDSWAYPSGPIGDDRSHPLFFTYSLLLATFLGTMGLPHILVRFYTNPDGRQARQTTVIVLALMAAF
jgi:Na+(H+)/acetate symporter ActP